MHGHFAVVSFSELINCYLHNTVMNARKIHWNEICETPLVSLLISSIFMVWNKTDYHRFVRVTYENTGV